MGADYCTYKAVEFTGDYIKGLTMDARFTITNMAIEMGAKAGIIPPDEVTIKYLKSVKCSLSSEMRRKILSFRSDEDAVYSEVLEYDISKIIPQVARPHTVDNVVPVTKLKDVRIDEAFIGTCKNGRLEDLKIASSILQNKRVSKYVKLIVAPASRSIFEQAMGLGIIADLVRAGACVISPGCGPCVGTHNGIPSKGENVISTANRNFKGRMGNSDAFIYLASPATTAASAIEARIADPRKYLR